jgi:hypothetical protein
MYPVSTLRYMSARFTWFTHANFILQQKQKYALTILGKYLKHPAKITIFKTRPHFQQITQFSKGLTQENYELPNPKQIMQIQKITIKLLANINTISFQIGTRHIKYTKGAMTHTEMDIRQNPLSLGKTMSFCFLLLM